jgi:hypothetical protein
MPRFEAQCMELSDYGRLNRLRAKRDIKLTVALIPGLR